MIRLLHIENIAVIEKADIEFAPGLNVLTGETGAGKSIVIDALSVVTGGRTSRDLIRTGEAFASVTAVFSNDTSSDWFEDNGIELDESGDVFISRRVSSDGKSVCRANGAPVSAAQLRELGGLLLDIHGQNDGRKLLDEAVHLAYLDAFGNLHGTLSAYQVAYAKLRGKKAEIERLTMDEREKERRIDALRYQIEEIGRAKVKPGEHDELLARREMMMNASKLTEAIESAFESLYGSDASVGAVAMITDAGNQLDRAAKLAEGLRGFADRAQELRYSAQDIADELRDFRMELDFSPEELGETEARLDALKRIIRKYGSEAEALDRLKSCSDELSDIEDSTNKLAKLEKELDTYIKESAGLADRLSDLRKEAAVSLRERVMNELSQLNMPGVSFLAEFSSVSGEYGLGPAGRDEICFLLSANAGEAPGRISRIASGGELARIMLALKNVISGEQDTGTMVFDEVDAGVSGVAAQRVGEKLAKLARSRQVLCVTHLPQIAVMADAHFEVSKTESGGRTFTHVDALDPNGRRREIARLSGGENITETTLKSAAEQLAAAAEFKKCRM